MTHRSCISLAERDRRCHAHLVKHPGAMQIHRACVCAAAAAQTARSPALSDRRSPGSDQPGWPSQNAMRECGQLLAQFAQPIHIHIDDIHALALDAPA